ncbi:MAG: peptidoglycan DD-metalloendopeptidase family protein [Synechococcaceae cyanobacterium]
MLLLLPGVVAIPAIGVAVSQRSPQDVPLDQQLLAISSSLDHRGSAAVPAPSDPLPEFTSPDRLLQADLPGPGRALPPGELVAALPSSDRLWMRVRQPVTVADLSRQIGLQSHSLATLNDVGTSHRFQRGEWVVLPGQQNHVAQRVAALDSSDVRRTPPPPSSPPPVQTKGVVRLGDTLLQIAQRYGVTMQELLRFNPGLDTARLVAGTEIQLVQSAPVRQRAVLGLRPSTSGGLSWPDQPNLGQPQQPFDDRGAHTWIWPTSGVFTSGYGWRWGRMHRGIDLANNVGTPIKAARHGRVVFSGWHDGGYGYLVTLQHPDGSRSLYAHNSRLMVSSGQEVRQGTVIALMGSTGRSTGPHLHFEIHPAGGTAVNPLNFLPPRA